MNAQEIIAFIRDAEKKTPVKLYFRASGPVDLMGLRCFGNVIYPPLTETSLPSMPS